MEDFFADRPKPSLYRRIRAWWVVEGKYSHKYFKIGVKNLWYWLPIIWKDRSWDHSYIYKILKHKLQKQAQFTQEKNWHTCSQQNARRMQICVKLIQSCKDDTYRIEYLDYTKERHWFEPCKDKEGYEGSPCQPRSSIQPRLTATERIAGGCYFLLHARRSP